MKLHIELAEFGSSLRCVNIETQSTLTNLGSPTVLDNTTTLYAFAACESWNASKYPSPPPPAMAMRIMVYATRWPCPRRAKLLPALSSGQEMYCQSACSEYSTEGILTDD